MVQDQSVAHFHDRFCPTRNAWVALFLTAFCAWEAFLSWKGLGKAYPVPSIFDRAFNGFYDVLTIMIIVRALTFLKCTQERLFLGLVIIVLVKGLIYVSVPTLFDSFANPVRQFFVVLWSAAFLMSLSMLVSSAQTDESA